MAANDPTFISDKQAGQRLGVSRQTIWRWHREDPQFPRFIKLGPGVSRLRLSDLCAWEQSRAEVS